MSLLGLTNRAFQFWEYRVGHQELLIRSPRTIQQPKNIDMIFVGVDYLSVPTLFGSLQLSKPTAEELQRIRTAVRKDLPSNRVRILVSHETRYILVAAGMKIVENELDPSESSLEPFSEPSPELTKRLLFETIDKLLHLLILSGQKDRAEWLETQKTSLDREQVDSPIFTSALRNIEDSLVRWVADLPTEPSLRARLIGRTRTNTKELIDGLVKHIQIILWDEAKFHRSARPVITDRAMRFNRKFQIWQYSISQSQLLLRSTKDQRHATQVDVLFKNVEFMQFQTLLSRLAISEVSEKTFRSLSPSIGSLPAKGRKYFRLEGDKWRGLVVAGHVFGLEEDADHFATSKLIAKVP